MSLIKPLLSHESVEWYTPPEVINHARSMLNHFDLDPASHPIPQEWIQAKTFYTKEDNGLNRDWYGTIWLNPPYSKTGNKSNQEIWFEKLVYEKQLGHVDEAIILLKAAVGYDWFDRILYDSRFPWCLHRGLIEFISPEGKRGKAKLGSAFFYVGYRPEIFLDYFQFVGKVGW